MDSVPKVERVTLSRDLSEFLVELSIAVQKHAIYPAAHPSLRAAMVAATRRAEQLLEGRATLVFGVARHQLIIDGVATDSAHPVLRRLAEGLHRHHLGAVSLSRGLQLEEMDLALRALSSEVDRDGPLGLAPAGRRLEWPNVRLHPLTFDRLELVALPGESTSTGTSSTRATELWIGLARAAMAADQQGACAESISTEPATVAKAIDERHDTDAYDQVIVGYLLQIADELKSASSPDEAHLRRRTTKLVKALRPETLRRLVTMGGNAAQRRDFVLNAASGMAVDSVVDILRAAADAGGETISHGMVRMLSKLAEHAELGSEKVRPLADSALRDQVRQLLSGWQIDDPNPETYGKILQHLATTPSAKQPPKAVCHTSEHDPLRIVQMSLELEEFGPLVDRAMDQIINEGRFDAVVHLLGSAPAGCGAAAKKVMAAMVAPAALARLAEHEPFDAEVLDKLLPSISFDGFAALLDALATSKNRSTRWKLLSRLARTELDVGPLIVARLEDDRWYVVRNMLMLLRRFGRIPAGLSPMRWADHPDVRVRYEAIHLGLVVPTERSRAIRSALEDRNVRILRLALMAVQHDCPGGLPPLVAAVAVDAVVPEELRLHAVRALRHTHDPIARDALLQLIDGGRTLLGKAAAGCTDTDLRRGGARAVGGMAGGSYRGADASPCRHFFRSEASSGGGVSGNQMSDPSAFLNSFAQALALATLYPQEHRSREKAIDSAYQLLDGLSGTNAAQVFTFLDEEVVYGRQPLRDLKDWPWGRRLIRAGIQRLEFERKLTRDEFESFLHEILARLMISAIDTSENRQTRSLGVRFGAVGIRGLSDSQEAAQPSPVATLDLTLSDETETMRWLQQEVRSNGAVPLIEAEAVVRSLSVAMHSGRHMILPLLQLKEFDQYTTTHSLNVAVLAMALAEHLGCRTSEVRAYGVAGLLHDIGKIRIPVEVLTKPGKLNELERMLINRHPAEGARIILQSDEDLELAAVVAYEHHIMLNGGGYPTMHYGRACAMASRLVHVCDVYDALRTKRPYRDAWESHKVIAYLKEREGTEFDPDLVQAFMRMLEKGETQVTVLHDEASTLDASGIAI